MRRPIALGFLFVVHLVLITRVFPLSGAVSGRPFLTKDHALHYYRAVSVGRQFLPEGSLWGYDPYHMAGYPAGTVTDLDDKAVEIFVGIVGPVLGDPGAFNLFLLLTYALFPLGFYLAAKLLGFRPRARLAAAVLSAAVWHFDGETSDWVLFGGFGFVHASLAAPLVFAALARAVERPTSRNVLILAATAPLFYLHVLTAVLVAVLGVGLLPRVVRAGGWGIARIAGAVAFIVLLNLPWLVPMVGDWHIIDPSSRPTVGERILFKPFFDQVLEGRFYGLVLPLLAGAGGLVALFREGRRAVAASWAIGIGILFVGAYEGGRIPFVQSHVEPARLFVALAFALVLPAGFWLERAAVAGYRRLGPARLAACVAVGAAVLYSVVLLPVATRVMGSAIVGTGLTPKGRRFLEVQENLGDPRGRVAMEETGPFEGGGPHFNRYVAAIGPLYTRRAWLGGPYYRGFTGHKAASFVNGRFGDRPIQELEDREISGFLDRYDVTGIAACTPGSIARFRRLPDLMREVSTIRPYVHFEVLRQANPFLVGAGELNADYDRIEVVSVSGGDVVLKLHFDPRLTVDGDRELVREPIPDDPIGFIRVRNAGRGRFVIRNGSRGD